MEKRLAGRGEMGVVRSNHSTAKIMSDFYPPCPKNGTECLFQYGPMMSTCMWSPILYDRDGKPVDGGRNHVTTNIRCATCGKSWISTRTELEIAQGVKPNWQEAKREYER